MADFSFMNNPDFGVQGAEKANAAQALSNLTAMKTAGDIQAQPAHLELLRAQIGETTARARGEGAQADQRELANQQARLAQMIQQQFIQNETARQGGGPAGPGGPTGQRAASPEDTLGKLEQQADRSSRLATVLMGAGVSEEANKHYKASIDMLNKISETRKTIAEQRNTTLSADEKSAQLVGRYMGNANNAVEWEAGKRIILEDANTAEKDKEAVIRMPFSEANRAMLQDRSMKALDKLQEARLRQESNVKRALDSERIRRSKFESDWGTIKKKAEIQYDAFMGKVAGSVGIRPATNAQLTEAGSMIRRLHFPESATPSQEDRDQIATAAAAAVQRAHELVSPTMPYPAALAAAVAENAKSWTPGVRGVLDNPITSKSAKYNSAGNSPTTAIAIPPRTSLQELKSDKYSGKYVLYQGQIGRIVGDNFIPFRSAGGGIRSQPPVDVEED